jgi:linoleoyl-CoA desaturase
MDNTWLSTNFTTTNLLQNAIVNWYTGGLNHQNITFFPNISHMCIMVKLQKIVKETAKECNLPYYEYKTMRSAVIAHFKHLKDLGTNPELIIAKTTKY